MILIDAAFRFSGIGFLLLLSIFAFRDFRKWQGFPYLILSCLSVGALLLGYSPDVLRPDGIYYDIIRVLDIPHLVFVWLLTLSLFHREFSLRWYHFVVAGAYCLPILWLRLTAPAAGVPLPAHSVYAIYWVSLASLLLITHLCVDTLWNFRDDLSDTRRKSRIYFVITSIFSTVLAAFSEPLITNIANVPTYTIKAISIWPAIFCGVYWMLGFRSTSVLFGMTRLKDKPTSPSLEFILHTKLNTEMVEKFAYMEQGLTIVELSRRLGVSQHKLRSFINHTLGYSNFSGFINSYRLKNAKSALADHAQNHKKILPIALDAGFNSLPSFNRIFKANEGITPSAYRDYCQESAQK